MNALRFFTLSIVIVLLSADLFSQAGKPAPLPPGQVNRKYMETMMVFADGFQGRSIDQILMWLHDGTQIFVFPDSVVAKGKIESKIFLEDVLMTNEDLHYEKGEFANIGDVWYIRFRCHPALEPGKEEIMVLMSFKEDKIDRLYFFNL